uniref:Pollen coat oleosin-glycine rich protein n=1 Tax=Capsella rubella TaxID=81985 RepID=Q6V5F3_9BRAS|nr:pollen coat oleosin-glycine rich protein [Capsella rubella]
MLFRKKKREKVIVRTKRPTLKGLMTAFFATTAAVFLLLLAGLSLVGTAVAASMPLFLLFSPILVPAGITATVLASGLMVGGTSGVTVLTILIWLYNDTSGGTSPVGAAPVGTTSGGAAPPIGDIPFGDASGGAAPAGGAIPDEPTTKPTAKATSKSAIKPISKPKTKPTSKPTSKPKKNQ